MSNPAHQKFEPKEGNNMFINELCMDCIKDCKNHSKNAFLCTYRIGKDEDGSRFSKDTIDLTKPKPTPYPDNFKEAKTTTKYVKIKIVKAHVLITNFARTCEILRINRKFYNSSAAQSWLKKYEKQLAKVNITKNLFNISMGFRNATIKIWKDE
jgi:hypothetical protein